MSALGMSSLLARTNMKGIAAIGDLMTPENLKDTLADDTFQDAGYLLVFLANLTLDLQHIEADAQYTLQVFNTKPKESHV